jgi:hypothetical protein
MMKKVATHLGVLLSGAAFLSGPPAKAAGPVVPSPEAWQVQVHRMLPLLGHRNWILIVDSAYPLQTSPGVETIETNASQVNVVREVLSDLDHSNHVRPIIFMDAELPFVTEQNAPGVEVFRGQIKDVLRDRAVTSLPHEAIIQKIGEAGQSFHVLVLKTTLTIPYTSVFLQLNCKYWSDAAEIELRKAMKEARP